jgi:putative transposase
MPAYRVSVRRACAVVKQWRPGWYYQLKEKGDGPLLKLIEEIASIRVRYGFWRIFVLLRREGWQVSQ